RQLPPGKQHPDPSRFLAVVEPLAMEAGDVPLRVLSCPPGHVRHRLVHARAQRTVGLEIEVGLLALLRLLHEAGRDDQIDKQHLLSLRESQPRPSADNAISDAAWK